MTTSFMLKEARALSSSQRDCFAAAAEDMDIMPVFSHCSAIRYWGVSPPSDCKAEEEPLHLSYPSRRARRRIRGTIAHMWKGRFVTSDQGTFRVAKPAMALAQVSEHCSEESIAVIAGMFACRDRKRRVASMDELTAYFLETKGFRGRGKCLAVMPFLMANADSPPENRLVVLLMRQGMGRPVSNHEVPYDLNAYYLLDLAYPELKIGIEYQGAYHANPAQMRADVARLNDLRAMGWEIIQVTAADLATEQAKARLIARIGAVMDRQRALLHLAKIWI